MRRDQFDHAVRAAAGVLGSPEIMVIGSQAIHAVVEGELPSSAERSMEVDVVPIDDADGHLADLVDGSVGEASGVVAWCIEPHDLWVSKAVEGREKDIEFCRALLELRLVDAAQLVERVAGLEVDEAVRARVLDRIAAWSTSD